MKTYEALYIFAGVAKDDILEASLAKSYERILDLEFDARVIIDRETGRIFVYEMVPDASCHNAEAICASVMPTP